MAAHHRHQASLEGVLDFSNPDHHGHESSAQAADIFVRLVRLFQSTEGAHQGYKRMTLLSSMYDAVLSKTAFLQYMFVFVENNSFGIVNDLDLDLSLALSRYERLETWDRPQQQQLENSLSAFADHLVDAFFLPMKALGATPILSPATPTVVPRTDIPAVDLRGSNLRNSCLRRDGHRCVVTQMFDSSTAKARLKLDRGNARDDDGNHLDSREVDLLQVSHIIPFSLASQRAKENRDMEDRKTQVAIRILDMFDPGVAHLMDGPGIDRPYNAISLTAKTHSFFGSLEIYFDPTEEKHTYIIRSWEESFGVMINPALPIRRTLRLDPDRAIDPPSSRLLAVHRAVGQILYLSAAGWYIDEILHDMEWVRVIAADGSTDLSSYVSARLGGWAEVSAVG